MENQPYRLGLPMWSNRDWVGSVFPSGANSQNYLRYYSSVFNTVEGNTTFYALPSEKTVASWCDQVQSGFTFCFKLPQTITHRGRLHSGDELTHFFNRLEPLGDALGPFMIQLPAQFGAESLSELARFIDALPKAFLFSVEVRHPVYFKKGEAERALNGLLIDKEVDRVCFDSRALFSQKPQNDAEIDAQRKKPQLPVHAIATAKRPIIRFIGSTDCTYNDAYLKPWTTKLSKWLAEGITPYMFIHTPSNQQAPEQAVSFHNTLSMLPQWQPLAVAESVTQLAIF